MSNHKGEAMFEKTTSFASLPDFVTAVARLATTVGEAFEKSDDDWAPVIVAATEDGHTYVDLIPMGTSAEKQYAFQTMIPNAIRARGIARVALVLSTWSVAADSDLEAMEIAEKGVDSVSEDRKYEMLWVVGHEDGAVLGCTAKIVRFPDSGPILGAWQTVTEDDAIFDRWKDPIQDALRDVASL